MKNKETFTVAIVGGGIGGLCLAQGLKKAGLEPVVYERDETSASRPQGFRVHIDPQGSAALHSCLPPHLWEVFDSTGGEFSQGFTLITEQLEELLCLHSERAPAGAIEQHRSISRITLRSVLLAGLGDNVHFNKRFARYEELPDGSYRLHFEDGSTATADLLVGADGVHSKVRRQYLPHAEPVDTGVFALGGKVPLSDGVMALAPARLLDGPIMVMPREPCSLFMAIWKRSPQASQSLRRLGIDQFPEGDEDYLILGLGGRPESLCPGQDPQSSSPSRLKDLLRRAVANWHPNLRKLVELAPEEEISLRPLRTSRPLRPWKPTRVTLLGDAIHSMTPYRGIGANIAFKDAALLCSKLAEAYHTKKPLLDTIAEYETAMRDYGFAAVQASLKSMEQAVGVKRYPAFAVMKAGMRVVNKVSTLKRKLAAI
jgi:2-polyprenyl-6-methoxyphenol hydroxylase-like FAD-dependent oxidoreductase